MINLFQCACVRANAKDDCVSLPFTRDIVVVVDLSHKQAVKIFSIYVVQVHYHHLYLKITTVLAYAL